MSTAKVLVVNDSRDCGASYYVPFEPYGKKTDDLDAVEDKDVVLVIFTGGADVTPSFYGEEANHRTYNVKQRDAVERAVFQKALKQKKNIAGICRGAQFICAMSGGKLVQHVNNHGGYHNVRTDDGRLINVSSVHHQMQLPPPDAVPIAWAEPKRSTCYEGPPGVNYTPDREHDVVWYPKTNALGMQYHPEFMDQKTEGFKYCQELVERFFKLERVA